MLILVLPLPIFIFWNGEVVARIMHFRGYATGSEIEDVVRHLGLLGNALLAGMLVQHF